MVSKRRDRAQRLQGGVRAGPVGGGARDVLPPGPSARRCLRDWRRTCCSTAAPRPCGRPRSPPRTRTGAAGSPGDRATAAAGGGAARRARLPRAARPLHARGPRPRERGRPPRRPARGARSWWWPSATPRSRRTPRAAPRTPRRCSSWRACSRGAPRARRWCSRRRTARRSARWARSGWPRSSARPPRWTPCWSCPTWARATRRGPFLQAWSNDSRRAGIALQRTVADSIRQELGRSAEASGVFGQLARLSFPIGVGAQGPLLERGYDAVRISGSGELPPPGNGPPESIDEDRLGTLGRATLRTVTAVDQGHAPAHGPETYLLAVSQVVPGWALALLAGALLLPVHRRERGRARPGAPAAGGGAALGALARRVGGGARVRARDGRAARAGGRHAGAAARADAPGRHAARRRGARGARRGGRGGRGRLARRAAARHAPRARARGPDRSGRRRGAGARPGAGRGAALAREPLSALLAVPAAHLWTLTALTRPPPPRRARAVLVALGALPAAARLGLLPVRALDRPAREPLVPAAARDRALARARVGPDRLPVAGGARRRCSSSHTGPRESGRSRAAPAGRRCTGPGATRARGRSAARNPRCGAEHSSTRGRPAATSAPARADKLSRGAIRHDPHEDRGRPAAQAGAGRVRGRRRGPWPRRCSPQACS